ncbi:MAG: hypothetical protein SOZ81_00855 [Agathobacter sp.]|nr:hypothetical protein [Agathobacter sp.]
MDKPFFKRKIYDEILEWKENRSDKYALLIKGARIIAICDSIDAITSNRCYRKAHNRERQEHFLVP